MAVHVPQQMCGIEGTWEGLMGDMLGLDVFLGVLQVPWGDCSFEGPMFLTRHPGMHLSSNRWSYLQLNDAS